MAASEGVDLEWAIVELARGDKLTRKYSKKVLTQAQQAVTKLKQKLGNSFKMYHSDEMKIFAKPEPKTDIVAVKGSTKYYISVKMEGGIQLASGQGRSTAELFQAAADSISDPSKRKTLKEVVSALEGMPTRLLSESNLSRILTSGNKKLIDEFLRNKKIKKEKSYEDWLTNKKPELMAAIMSFVKNNPEFKSALIYEALTGKKTLKQFKGAAATHILSPKGFYTINKNYVNSIASKVKMDVRAKSRSGITSVAFRIETTGSL